MTRDQFTRSLPPISNNPLPVKPPLMFRGVSVCCFPLRANLDILQQLCDSYLNIMPPEAGYFRAPLPYVYLVILDYGQMGEMVMRAGWFSQVEVYFGVFVEWYKLVRGHWEFHDWGVITPYIFVSDDISVMVGRTVYGFPKIPANVELIDSQWIKNPVAPVTLARIETAVFPEVYSGTSMENRVLLEINKTWASDRRVPYDPGSPMMPWTIAANLANEIGGFGRDAMWLAQAMRISPLNPLAHPLLFQQMLRRVPPWFAPGGPGFVVNSLNLKQFRQSQDPSRICYQALTNGCLQTTGFNGGGLLGEDRVLLGDLTGGHSIKLYEHSSLPIGKTLGLEVCKGSSIGGSRVDELTPVAPFWVNVDLKYHQGVNLAWRTEDGVWRNEAGGHFASAQNRAAPEYNNTVSTTIEAIAGPFEFFDVTIRVLPLLAHTEKLQKLLDCYLNEPFQSPIMWKDEKTKVEIRFEVWGRQPINSGEPKKGDLAYVYLTAASFGAVTSETNNVGNWAKYELEFTVPVRWLYKAPGERNWKLRGVGLVPAFSFVDGDIAAFTRFEIQGIPTAMAKFLRPESIWLSSAGELANQQTLLCVDAEVLPALGTGQTAKFHPVIKIIQGGGDARLGDGPGAPGRWAGYLVNELDRKKATKLNHSLELKTARALALNLLGHETPFSWYALKQFPDVTDPGKACYQSLECVSRLLKKEDCHLREIEDTLVVRIYDYPNLKIAETLGLVAQTMDDNTAGIVHVAQAIRPFYLRATLEEPLAKRLAFRSGSTQWTLYDAAFDTLLSGKKNGPGIAADWTAAVLQDQADPSLAATIMSEARRHPLDWDDRDRKGELLLLQAFYGLEKNPWAAPSAMDQQTVIDALSGAAWDALSAMDQQTVIDALSRMDQEKVIEVLGAAWDALSAIGQQTVIESTLSFNAPAALSVIDPQTVIESILSREWFNNDPNARWRTGNRELLKAFSALPQRGDAKAIAEILLCGQINNSRVNFPGAVACEIPVQELHDIKQLAARLLRRSQGAQEIGTAGNSPADEDHSSGISQSSDTEWQKEMMQMITHNLMFTIQHLRMERSLKLLAPFAIMSSMDMEDLYRHLGKPKPSVKQLCEEWERLLKVMWAIYELGNEPPGNAPNPSVRANPLVRADNSRLKEVIDHICSVFKHNERKDFLELLWGRRDEFRQLVTLARRCCDAQRTALLNKLSRTYQKPDFCIRRDALGHHRDQLLPLELSWDEDWFYGQKITQRDDRPKPQPVSGEKR